MHLIDPFLFEKVHLLIVLAFTIYFFFALNRKNAQVLLVRKKPDYTVFLYAILYIIIVGFRPISSAFGDTVNYAHTYENFSLLTEKVTTSRDSLFYLFMWLCSQFMSVRWFFFIVEILYVLPIMIACHRLLNKNAGIGLLFCIAAFSFFSYSVNGIRNGMALSFVFLAMTYIRGTVSDKIICGILSFLAIAFHASSILPVLCMLAASVIKKPKLMFYFWGMSIILSLVAGNAVANVLTGLGFGDRLLDYIHPDIEEDLYTVTGFRWDFLLYSSAPLLLGWYLIFKKKIYNSTYILLLGTYIFANAFWIMVIRAEFSNRFAYLSWFLYPIALAYPLLKLRIWPHTQGQKTAIIMAAHYAFTFIMVFLF